MTKGKYYDYLERYNHMAGNDYRYDTDNESDYRYVKSSLLKHIDWQLKSMAYDLDKYNSLKMILHKRKYQKLLRNIHDMKELREKIEENKQIDLMYFTGTYRGAMSGICIIKHESGMDSDHDTCCYLFGCSRYFLHNVVLM